MDNEKYAEMWECLAELHDERARRLAVATGDESIDVNNRFYAEVERSEAMRCREFAERTRDRERVRA